MLLTEYTTIMHPVILKNTHLQLELQMFSHALEEKKAHPEGGCIQIEPFNTQ